MSNSLYSNKIQSLHTSLKSNCIDPNQIRDYKSQLKNIRDFQNKEKQKIEKKSNEANGRLKLKQNSESNLRFKRKGINDNNNNNNNLNLNNANDKKFKNNAFKKNNKDEEDSEIFSFYSKNLKPSIKRDIEQITLKIKERYSAERHKDQNNISTIIDSNKPKLKLPMTAFVNKNKRIKNYILNNTTDKNNNLEIINKFENANLNFSNKKVVHFDFKDKSNSSDNLTSQIITNKLHLNSINNSLSSLGPIPPSESQILLINNNNENNQADNNYRIGNEINKVKITQNIDFFVNMNKQINELYLSNSRNNRNNQQNFYINEDLSNIDKCTKNSVFDLTKNSGMSLLNKTANLVKENLISSSISLNVNDKSKIANFHSDKNNNLILDKQKLKVKNNKKILFDDKIKIITKNKTNKIKIVNNIKVSNKLNAFDSNQPNENNKIQKENAKKLTNNEIYLKHNEISFWNFSEKNLLNKITKNYSNNYNNNNNKSIENIENIEKEEIIHQKKVENNAELRENFESLNLKEIVNSNNHEKKMTKNKIKRISILKHSSNQTHKSASTSAPSNLDLNYVSLINNKMVVDQDDPYGISNLGTSGCNSASNSITKDNKIITKFIDPFDIISNAPEININYDEKAKKINHLQGETLKEKQSSFNNFINSKDFHSKSAKRSLNPNRKQQELVKFDSSSTDSFFRNSESSFTEGKEEADNDNNQKLNPERKQTNNNRQLTNIKYNEEDFNENIKSKIELKSNFKNAQHKSHSTNRYLPVVNKDEINCEVLIEKLKRENQRQSIPLFKNQFNLNNHLIRDFQIGMVSDPKNNSKKKYTMTEKLHLYNENKRNSIREDYIKSLYGSAKLNEVKNKAEIKGSRNHSNQKFGLYAEDHFYKLQDLMIQQHDLDKKNKVLL